MKTCIINGTCSGKDYESQNCVNEACTRKYHYKVEEDCFLIMNCEYKPYSTDNKNVVMYCMRTLTRINYMDQSFTKQVLHVYTIDTCSILYCYNSGESNPPNSQFKSPCNKFTSDWPRSMSGYDRCRFNIIL